MRLAFWRGGEDRAGREKPEAEQVVAEPAPVANPAATTVAGDLDFGALGQALVRKRGWIIFPTLLAAVLSITAVNLVTPRYKSEARILVDGRENVFLRPTGERNEERTALDAEAVTSQVQLLLSRDLAREVIRKNKLAELPEFDPVLQGISPLKSLLALFGIGRDPFSLSPEERVLDAYYDRFTAYAVDKSRVIVIEFQSRDPDLAARVANSIAEFYLVLQQNARQDQAKAASQWLSGEIDSLRKKVADAKIPRRGFPLEVEPVRRHQQYHAVEPADGRAEHAIEQRARAEIGRGIEGAADPRNAPGRQADRGVGSAQFGIDPQAVRTACHAARSARRTVLDAARQPSADQGAEGAACRSRPPNSRRGQQAVALTRQ